MKTDIENKEKALAELMGKILAAPLKPVTTAAERVADSLDSLQDKLQKVSEHSEESLSLIAEDTENSRKLIKSSLIELFEYNNEAREKSTAAIESIQYLIESSRLAYVEYTDQSQKRLLRDIAQEISTQTPSRNEINSFLNGAEKNIVAAVNGENEFRDKICSHTNHQLSEINKHIDFISKEGKSAEDRLGSKLSLALDAIRVLHNTVESSSALALEKIEANRSKFEELMKNQQAEFEEKSSKLKLSQKRQTVLLICISLAAAANLVVVALHYFPKM